MSIAVEQSNVGLEFAESVSRFGYRRGYKFVVGETELPLLGNEESLNHGFDCNIVGAERSLDRLGTRAVFDGLFDSDGCADKACSNHRRQNRDDNRGLHRRAPRLGTPKVQFHSQFPLSKVWPLCRL